jgi:hypothetical protein
MAGYGDIQAKKDLDMFFAQIERPRGIHLCGNPDWEFLLNLDMDVVSMDIYTNAEIVSSCATSIQNFLNKGGRIVWGIVPTGFEPFSREGVPSLIERLEAVWTRLWKKGVDRDLMLERSLLSPATCCLINPDREKTVEKAFETVKLLSGQLRSDYRLN